LASVRQQVLLMVDNSNKQKVFIMIPMNRMTVSRFSEKRQESENRKNSYRNSYKKKRH
jgi:hypothetical protein